MQNTREVEQLNTAKHLSCSFELTKLWIEKSEVLTLSATAVAVMTALLWHYNPTKKYVFPHQETISKRIKRSVATVKRAINELKQAGYIISSRTRNGNLYAFTKKFFDLLEPSDSALCTEPTAQNELCMNHEHVREQIKQTTNKVVVFSSKKISNGVEGGTQTASRTTASVSSNIHYDEIPDILKRKAETGEIKNLQGYWRSLRPQIKQEYIEKDTAEKLKIQKLEELKELKKQEQIRKIQEERELKEDISKPLNEQFTREQAIQFVKRIYSLKPSLIKSGIPHELISIYNIQEAEIK